MSDDLYCKIFVLGPTDKNQLTRVVVSQWQGVPGRFNMACAWGTADIRPNDDADRRRMDEEDGFLFFPWTVETDIDAPSYDQEHYIRSIASLLEEFWTNGWRAVAACSFESELPRSGGFPEQPPARPPQV